MDVAKSGRIPSGVQQLVETCRFCKELLNEEDDDTKKWVADMYKLQKKGGKLIQPTNSSIRLFHSFDYSELINQ